MKQSATIFSLDWHDALKGFITAVLSSLITALYNGVIAGNFPDTWIEIKPILLVGLGAGLAYIIKNFFTNSEDDFMTKEPPKTGE